MSILIVDDSSDFRNLVYGMLSQEGFNHIQTASTGMDAIKALTIPELRNEKNPVEVVLLDISLPEMDGIETCRRIRLVDELKDLPILIVTVRDKLRHLSKAFEVGATDFISKPVERVELLARVKSALRSKRQMDRYKEQKIILEKTVEELEQVLLGVRELRGVLPMCSKCNKVRNHANTWQRLENYIMENTDIEFEEDLCVDCLKIQYPDIKV